MCSRHQKVRHNIMDKIRDAIQTLQLKRIEENHKKLERLKALYAQLDIPSQKLAAKHILNSIIEQVE